MQVPFSTLQGCKTIGDAASILLFSGEPLLRRSTILSRKYLGALIPGFRMSPATRIRLLARPRWHAIFDEAYYVLHNPDVVAAKTSPLRHFEQHGCFEGRSPNADFDMLWFFASEMVGVAEKHLLARVRRLGLLQPGRIVKPADDAWMASGDLSRLPSRIRQIIDDIHTLKSSGLFDEDHIREQIPASISDVGQYFIRHGSRHTLNPCRFFDTKWYRKRYRDASSWCAVLHYIRYGAAENRDPGPRFSTGVYRARVSLPRQANPLAHYLASGGVEPVEAVGGNVAVTSSGPLVPPVHCRETRLDEAFAYSVAAGTLLCRPNPRSASESLQQSLLELLLRPYGAAASDRGGIDPAGTLTALSLAPRRRLQPDNPYCPDRILGRYHDRRVAVGAGFSPDPDGAGTRSGPVRISVVMPTYRSPPVFLHRAILSLLNQTYSNWQLCIFDDASRDDGTRVILRYYAALDPRIRVAFGTGNSGISAASNGALDGCDGDYVGLLDHDDMLAADALQDVAAAIERTRADVLYSDECRIDEDDVIHDFFSKPDWSPLLLLNSMYIGHFTVYRRDLIQSLRFRSEYDFSQDYDLALRATGRDGVKVEHIERCLYGWRMIGGSAAQGDKPEARKSNVAALQADLERRGWSATVTAEPFANAVHFKAKHAQKVSIIIPSDDADNICAAVALLWERTAHQNCEILVVTRSDVAEAARRRLPACAGSMPLVFVGYDKTFNISDRCNAGAERATGRSLVFFNDDVRVLESGWLGSMLDLLALDGVGAVGPKLLYEDGSVRHGGMVTGVRRFVGTACHAFAADSPDYSNVLQVVRETSLLCGACLAVRADLFRRLSGFDAVNTPIMNSDVDLCLRIREAGWRCVYTPYACLTHIGHVSTGAAPGATTPARDKADIFIMKRFAHALARDPYFTKSMRDMIHVDSQEPFDIFPGERERLGYGDRGRDVLLFSHDLSGSGAPKIVYDMAEVLRRRGDYVVVVSPEDGPFRQRLVAIGVDVIIDALVLSAPASIVEFASGFDVVIANTVLTWRLAGALGGHARVLVYAHETGLIETFASTFPDFAASLNRASIVLAASEFTVTALARRGVAAQRLGYGIDEPASAEPAQPVIDAGHRDAVKVCLTGTIEPSKGQDIAVLGFMKLPEAARSRFRLSIIGRVHDKPFEAVVRNLAAGTPEIAFEEPASVEDFQKRLADCDVVLCPSRDGALPLASLDALALGKTLIVSTTTGTSAYLDHGVSGILLRDNDPADVARALLSVSDARRRKSIGRAAREVYRRNFTRERFETRFLCIVDGDARQGAPAASLGSG